jgi:hypothetical protein
MSAFVRSSLGRVNVSLRPVLLCQANVSLRLVLPGKSQSQPSISPLMSESLSASLKSSQLRPESDSSNLRPELGEPPSENS